MFENIDYQMIELPHTWRKQDYFAQVQSSSEDPDFFEFASESEDFSISGTTYYYFQTPVTSAQARQNLIYLQYAACAVLNEHSFAKNHAADHFVLLYSFRGECIIEYKETSLLLTEESGVLFDAGHPFTLRITKNDWFGIILYFNGPFARYVFSQFIPEGIHVFQQTADSPFSGQLEELLRTCQNVHPMRELYVSNGLENILMTVLSSSSLSQEIANEIPEDIRHLATYIEHNYAHHLTLDFLSEFANISKYHLIRVFKKYIGYSPKEYIILLQIENAKKLLSTTPLPIYKIGMMVGIENENYFSRIFKAHVGMSPSEWRGKLL